MWTKKCAAFKFETKTMYLSASNFRSEISSRIESRKNEMLRKFRSVIVFRAFVPLSRIEGYRLNSDWNGSVRPERHSNLYRNSDHSRIKVESSGGRGKKWYKISSNIIFPYKGGRELSNFAKLTSYYAPRSRIIDRSARGIPKKSRPRNFDHGRRREKR